jgi:hypothetical protein
VQLAGRLAGLRQCQCAQGAERDAALLAAMSILENPTATFALGPKPQP